MKPLMNDALGNRRSIQLSYGTERNNGQNSAEIDRLPHTLTTPESASLSTVGDADPKLNARPRLHPAFYMAAADARPELGLFGKAEDAVAATGARQGIVWGPGVYFLMKNGLLIYIGQSKNVGRRIAGHAEKQPDDAWVLCVAEKDLVDAESNFIALLCPPMNRHVDPYPDDWLISKRVSMGIATPPEKASLHLPDTFIVGSAPEVFGEELGNNAYLHADRVATRSQAQFYLNQVRRNAMSRALRQAVST